MSETVDLDEIERVLLARVTPENVTSLLLLDIARSLRALTGRGMTVSVMNKASAPVDIFDPEQVAAYLSRNLERAERPDAAAVPSQGAG